MSAKKNTVESSTTTGTSLPTTPTVDEVPAGNQPNINSNLQRGLSTKVALKRLHNEIENVLIEYERKYAAETFYRRVRSAFAKRYESPLGWVSIVTTLVTICALLIAGMYTPAVSLLAILLLDLFVVIRENNLRSTEIFRKTRHALNELHLAEQHLCDEWQPCNYPHLCSPMSPCVSLQWTYRDGVIVNLPWALLVRGDYIVLRPGHIAPGDCIELSTQKLFNAHEIYGASQISDPPVKPVARAPLPDLVCCLKTTPYLENLRICFNNSLKRPPTIYNQQRYLLVTKYIQQWGFICALGITFCAGLLRLHGYGLPTDEEHNWRFVLVESPAAAVIPLMPLIFPLMWISLNLWGIARLQVFLKTPQMIHAKTAAKSFEEDLDTPSFDYESISLLRSQIYRTWLRLWRGESELLSRSANVVQVLGSITALCCVDKKGILSWPNPTAEKVFFLHNTDDDHAQDERRSNSQLSMQSESDDVPDVNEESKERGIVAEVLDLTHDQHCPFRLEFDDHEWKAHIKSLKPLGLAILLNTCSPLTHAHYAQFCGHVTAVAMLDKDLVPVTNRYAIIETSMKSFLHGRCLCELAKQIGFTDHATDRFTLEGQLASYRHLQPDVVRRDIRFARQLQLSSKVKVPFPHSLSVVMRENPGGYLSLFTQGTADIILDCCDDFWDGKDLRPLSPQDRKRALDFYQRSALTAYCTAFSYRPLRHGISGALSGLQQNGRGPIAYLELPPETKLRMQHVDKMHCDFESNHNAKLSHSISTDSLLFSESKEEDINDVESCFEMQCHQVFIGMVTMQYQAQTDIVQLVERLERACIRFVHFSKENELRSRVFSEKMGLESGWNCHISLLSEQEEKSIAGDKMNTSNVTGRSDGTSKATNSNRNHIVNTTTPTPAPTNHNTTNIVITGDNANIEHCNNHESSNIVCTNTNTNTNINTNTNNTNITNTSTINTSTANTTITPNTIGNTGTTETHGFNAITIQTTPAGSTVIAAPVAAGTAATVHDTVHAHYHHVQDTFSDPIHDFAGDCNGYNGALVAGGADDDEDDGDGEIGITSGKYNKSELKYLLGPPTNLETSKTLSSSAPGAISNPEEFNAINGKTAQDNANVNNALCGSRSSLHADAGTLTIGAGGSGGGGGSSSIQKPRHSLDSAMDENCRSLSTLTESTEQSAPVNFDMSNRAKLPRGIENIRPHLEQVDNVPLQVSLFTDCSAEATRQMLDIMQSYGEIVVCLGSSASNSNAEIFLQADCSIAVEPLYPQVCQDVDAYNEANIHNNKLRLLRTNHIQEKQPKLINSPEELFTSQELLESGIYSDNARPMQAPANTISPIYLSRLLNSLPCSISICREDPLSLVAIIELSRRFSSGLWNCIQYWACCAGALSIVNVLCACLSLPPLLTPLMVIYLMSVPVPIIALSLAHIDIDPKIMNRATGKKQTEYDTRVFGFVVWCYGCKFIAPILCMLISYCIFMTHPRINQITDNVNVDDDNNLGTTNLTIGGIMPANNQNEIDFLKILFTARTYALLGILLHFVLVSASFVHRDHTLWQRNPFRNSIWAMSCILILLLHIILCVSQTLLNPIIYTKLTDIWPAIVVLYAGSLVSLIVSELTKMHEINVNARYQRRARLDFGTKLGMNSPF